jgi:polymorphic membrane protein
MNRFLVAAVVGALCLAAGPRPAAAGPSIKVGNGKAASCSETALRTALDVAEVQGGGIVYFRCGPHPVTILLTEPLVLPDHTDVNGEGRITLEAVPINGAFLFTTLFVDPDSSVLLSNLGVRLGFTVIQNDGNLTVHNGSVAGSIAHNLVNTGTLTIQNSAICCEVNDVAGGGVLNVGTLVIDNTTFSNSFGGGISNAGTGTALIINSRFSRNQFPEGFGGAVFNSGIAVIHNSRFSDNLADARGGAIENVGALSISNSTFSGNTARLGGGISNRGTLFIFNSSITHNTARVSGGGVYTCCGGRTTLLRTSVTGNTPDNIVDVP